jgi:hypothetical protein
MALSVPYPTLGTGLADSTKIDSNFAAVTSKFNGAITNADIATGAAIAVSKLAASYEYITVPIRYTIVGAGGMPPVSTVLGTVPMYNDGKGAWTAAAYSWYCDDVGAQTGKINIKWGCYTTGGAISAAGGNPIAIKSGETLDGGTANTPFQDGATASVSLTWNQNNMILYVDVNTQDATALSADGNSLVVNVLLKRAITA